MLENYFQLALSGLQLFMFRINQLLTPRGCMILAIVFLFMLVMLRLKFRNEKQQADMQSMYAIAGDNVMTTQLDLARAYLEMNEKKSAKKILKQVCRHGDAAQRQEAKRLIKAN